MKQGIDYAWGKPGGAVIKEKGYEFVCRYLSNQGNSKNITKSELQDLKDNGLSVCLVWETSEQRVLDGFDAGANDAHNARSLANDVGFPSDKPMYYAADYDFGSDQQDVINQYFKGVASVEDLSLIGVYAGLGPVKRLFDAGLITYGWQTYAWSYGKWDERAQLQQYSNYGHFVNGVDVDLNRAVKDDFGQY